MKLEVVNLSKNYGQKEVLKNVSLTINGGEIFCLLGKNGSGKSTMINILTNLLEPDKGKILFNGSSFSDKNTFIKKHIGLQSQYEQLIEELNTYDYLDLIGTIYEMKKTDIKERINYLVNYFFESDELKDLHKSISVYSAGMKKKVLLCSTLLHKPDIVFFDEPFINLDPIASNKLSNLLKNYINEDRIIFISSHDLLYVKNVSTTISILHSKEIVYRARTENIPFSENNKLEDIFLSYMKINEEQDVSLMTKII